MDSRLALSVLLVLFTYHAAQGTDSSLSYRDDEHFLSWCSEFCESEEDGYRARIYPTWRENADYVQKHNALGLSYSLSLNRFAHLSRDEFAKRNLQSTATGNVLSEPTAAVNAKDPLPKSVDWRKKGVVPPVQNQGQCGSAVVYQVVHAVDCFHAIQTGELVLASIEEYVDCCQDGSCFGVLYGEESYTCIVKNGGLASEADYNSPDHKCLNNTFPPSVKIDGGKFVTPAKNETELAYAVAVEPVVAAIDASHISFQLYSSGIYYEPDCSPTLLDHAVLIVGYGSEGGTDYWICQNSWGTSWGMEGYIYMARNRDNNCGISTDASYPY